MIRAFLLVVLLVASLPVLAVAGALVGAAITALCVLKLCLEVIGAAPAR